MDTSAEVPVYHANRRILLDMWRQEQKENRISIIYNNVRQILTLEDFETAIRDILLQKITNICKLFQQKWQNCHSSLVNFEHKYSEWLSEDVDFHDVTSFVHSTPSTSQGIGRPKKLFDEGSDKTKKRKLQPPLKHSTEKLVQATRLSYLSKGKRAVAQILKAVAKSPEEVTKLQKSAIKLKDKAPIKLTANEALASFITNKLTKHQYKNIKKETKSHNADVYPSYDILLLAKKRCYPETIEITETFAEINLQSLVNHTVKRLFCYLAELFHQEQFKVHNSMQLIVTYKWGCDGATGYTHYKQKFAEENTDRLHDDSFLFIISMVPLTITNKHKILFWCNPHPSSTSYCRPIKIIMKRETDELVREEISKVEHQITHLSQTVLNIGGKEMFIEHNFILTMVDGKICGYLTGKHMSTCYICGAKAKDMNNLQSHKQRNIDTSALSYGLSSLHAWIKCFECILHISFRLDFKQWQVRGEENKEKFQIRKKQVQDRLRKEMGLLVDIPKPGFGTTNDDNTARRFFSNPTVASEITGVNRNSIFRLSIILRTIASGFPINSESFDSFAFETAKEYITNYQWYYMPPTLHKLLVHGAEIIKYFTVPIGQLSEEAQESRHKDSKRFRENHSRKFSRTDTMEDLVHMLLISSDPLISNIRFMKHKSSGTFPKEIRDLLQPTALTSDDETDSDSDN